MKSEAMLELQDIAERAQVVPATALVLGSGLGGLADAVEEATVIPTEEIAGYPRSSVAGHEGRLVIGRLEGVPVLVIQGRVHLYEGHDVRAVTYPMRLAHQLGARRVLLTNAAGGIHPNAHPGTLMFITDHLNFAGAVPMVGGVDDRRGAGREAGPSASLPGEALMRIRPRATPYDPEWIEQAERSAIDIGIRTTRGVYLWTRGPSYETRAEIAAFRRLGADAVGMSTVPEVLQASALGMAVLGISSITNRAAGLSKEPLSHEDVLRVGGRTASDLERLVRRILQDASDA